MPVLGPSNFHTHSVSLTTTSDTDCYVVPNNFSSHVEHFFISNNNSGGISYTLKFYHKDDNTTHTLLSSHSVDGKSMESIFTIDKPFYMHEGDKLIVAAATANALVVSVSAEEFFDPNR